MNITAPATALARSARRSLVLLVAAAAAFLSLNIGGPAEAATFYGHSGSYGGLTVYNPIGRTVNTCYPIDNCYGRQIDVPGPVVGRAPGATAAQSVTVQFRTFRWNGSSWALYSSVTRGYSIGSASAIRLAQESFSVGSGYYRVQMTFTWKTTSTGVVLGGRSVTDDGNDYSCANQTIRCTPGTGWVNFA